MPRLRQIAEQKLAEPDCGDPFSWELFRLFGAFPAVVDRHVTEFFPQLFRTGEYYGKKLGVDAFSFEGTIARGDKIYQQMREQAFSDEPLGAESLGRSGGEHEQVVDIIDSIRADSRKLFSANLPNAGQVPNLPPEAVIECPAIAGRERPASRPDAAARHRPRRRARQALRVGGDSRRGRARRQPRQVRPGACARRGCQLDADGLAARR